jgi:hypothetical protein
MITVITHQSTNNIDFIIKDFYYNYFYNDVISYNKLYINSLIKINLLNTSTILNDILNKYLLDNKIIVTNKIKKDEYSFSEFYSFISKYKKKIVDLQKFSFISYNDDLIYNNLIYNPIVITFFENNLIEELYKNKNIILLITCTFDKLLSRDKFICILNKYSNIVFLNYPKFNYNIPLQYKLLYQFKLLKNYIINFIHFLDITIELYKELCKLFNNILKECTLYQINNILQMINDFNKFGVGFYWYYKEDHRINMCGELIKRLNNCDHGSFFELLKVISNMGKYIHHYYLIMEDEKFVNYYSDFIHSYIYNDTNCIFSIIKENLELYSNIKVEKNKELFLKLYHEKIIVRFLSNNCNIDKEKHLLHIMTKNIGLKTPINKIINVIHDMEMSKKHNDNFFNSRSILYTSITDTFDQNIINLSYSNWNINFNQGSFIVRSNSDNTCKIDEILHDYNEYYESFSNYKKTLLWLLHHGEIIIEYMNKDIKMLPIQFLLFDIIYKEDINIQDLLKNKYLTDYSEIFRKNLINSLIISNMVISDKNILKLNVTENIETNLIIIFQKYNHKLIEKKKFTLDKDILIKCHLNHIIKKQPQNFESLFKKCQDKFNVDCELFSKIIDKMITQDYIILRDTLYHKLF